MHFTPFKNPPILIADQDFELLTKPVAKNDPCGPSLRYEKPYDVIQEARKAEEDLPQGVWTHELKEADWDMVITTCKDILLSQSKDIQVSLWLTEAWFQEYQLYGLNQGLRVTYALMEAFWDSFHPQSDTDPEYRLAPLLWFDREMSKAITQTIIALPEESGYGAQTFWTYQSKVLANQSEEKKKDVAKEDDESDGASSFYDKIKETPTAFFEGLHENVKGALENIRAIESLVEQNYKDFPGCLMHCRGRLEKLNHFVKQILQERIPRPETTYPEERATPSEISQKEKIAPSSSTPSARKKVSLPMLFKNKSNTSNVEATLQDRQQAYDMLGQIADFLAEIEPHSPTPNLIRRAVSWGNMSLGELLQELVQQTGDMQTALRVLGMDKGRVTPPPHQQEETN